MPMTTEVCATCGCNEFAHGWDEETDEPYCECGECDNYTWIDEPDEILCFCGCPQEEHADNTAGECRSCYECDRFEAHGPAYEVVRERVGYYAQRLEAAGGDAPHSARRSGEDTLEVSWLDEPVAIKATVIREEDRTRRVNRLPEPDEVVLVYLAVTADGMDIAVSADEVSN